MPGGKGTEVVTREVQPAQSLQEHQRIGQAVQTIMAQVQHREMQESEY
jgi:hypothetical protein